MVVDEPDCGGGDDEGDGDVDAIVEEVEDEDGGLDEVVEAEMGRFDAGELVGLTPIVVKADAELKNTNAPEPLVQLQVFRSVVQQKLFGLGLPQWSTPTAPPGKSSHGISAWSGQAKVKPYPNKSWDIRTIAKICLYSCLV